MTEYSEGWPERLDGVEARLRWARVGSQASWGEVLSEKERQRLEEISHEPTAKIYIRTRRLVRATLSEMGAEAPGHWRFGSEEHGRPYLKNPGEALEGLDFNVAHARRLVVMAWTRRGRVGIDLEPVDREVDHDLVARRFFHRREIEALRGLDEEARKRRFMALWVLKEAWMKADGRGIGAGLSNVVYRFGVDDAVELVATPGPDDPARVEVALREVAGHWVAVVRRRQ